MMKLELVFLLKTKPVAISAIEREMSDDPEAAPDLHDVLDENLEASDELQAELAVIKPNIYLPPVISEQKEKEEAQLRKNTEQEEDGDDISKNNSDDSLQEKEPSKKKNKKKKKA